MMRSLHIFFRTLTASAVLALGGCLISEEPLLYKNTGQATPLDNGAYMICPIAKDAGDECNQFVIAVDDDGLYRFVKTDNSEQETLMRFRRIGRSGYLVQSNEGDDTYMYYYGAGDSEYFALTMMMCQGLPEKTRNRMIARGSLEPDDEDAETCLLKTLRSAEKAARIYHRGKAVAREDGEIIFEIKPASTQ